MSKVFTFTTSYVLPVLLTIGVLFGVFLSYVSAQPLPQINYQGKLTEPSGVAVADGSYNMRFYLYNATGGATTTAIWTETRTGGNAVTVTDGLFSVMLGSVNPGPGVNFNQPLYLGVEIGGSGAIAWDGEMTPRKELGTVPAAFQAYELGGVASSSFLRSDEADTLSASTATALLTLEQTGSGNILDVLNSVGSTTFTILENGSIGIGTDTPVGALNLDKGWGLSNGLTFGDGDTGISESANDSLSYVASIHSFSGQVRVGNGSASSPALSVGNTSMGLFAETPGGNDNLFFATEGLARMVINNAGNVGVGTTSPYAKLSVDGDLALTGGLYDSNATRGTNGQILQTTGSATRWVATSSLGFGTGDGTVTSVALSAPTGFTVSGSPVTSAGTLALSYAAGFEGLRTASSTNWNTFYTNPSSRITAGSNLAWSGNTLNATYAGAAGGWSVFNGTDVAISNSAAETTTFSTSIPSNLLNGDGQEISFTAVGTYVNTTGGNTNHTLRFKVNGTTVYADVTGNISSNAIGRPLTITGKIIRTSPTTAKIVADVKLANAGSATTGSGDYGATSVRTISSISTNASWNWSATTTFASTIQLSSAAASHTYTHDFISMNVNGEVDSTSLFTDAGDTTYLTSLTDKLAIGTTSATRLLEVYGAANAGGRFIDSTNGVTLDVRAEDFQGFMGTVSNNDLRFLTNNISRMVLDTDGDFSIGTTSNLTARFNVQTTGTNDILNLFETGGSEVLTVQEDGNVGIGTTTPNSKLTIQQSADNNGFSLRGFDNESNEGLDMLVDSAGGVYLDIVGLTGFGYLSQGASIVAGWNASRFGLADDKELSVGDSTDYSLGYDSISDSFRIVDGDDVATNVRLAILSNGNIGIGTTTPSARLSLQNNTLSGAGVSGLDQLLTTTNSVASAVQFGNRFNLNANNTATTTIVGSIYRIADDTSFGNTVRGLEVQTNRGANTQGENTALSGFARTFGVRGVTSADAGGSFEPAGGFFETEGTTQGNALRAYSGSITTATLLSLFQDTSAFTGTGLEMNFGNTTGSFSSSSSKYLDFQNGGSTVFTVSAYGTTTIGDGTTSNFAGLQVGYGGICVDNDGTCTQSTAGRISSVSQFTGNSDLAEMYFSSQSLTPGELVTMAGDLSVVRAVEDASLPILGVVSTKPGITLGFDDTSTRRGERGFPIALSGRVPVQLSTENGPIKKGDRLMLSSLPGIAMKATGTGMTVGIALEDFNESRKYSDTYLNQFGDGMVDPVYEPVTTNDDPRINDGCYYGGGAAAGEAPCVPLKSTSTAGQIQEVNQQLAAESVAAQIQQLKRVGANTRRLATGESVKVGQVVMFVENSWRWLDEDQLAMVNSLMSTSSITEIGENEDETLLDRLVSLANRFVDGVFSVFELRADRVEVAEELCVDEVCIDADDLRTMLEQNNAPRNESSSPQDQSGNTDSESDGSGDSSNGGGSDSAANDSSDNGTVNPENQIDTQASPTPASSTASTTQSHDTPTSGATSTSNNTTPSTATEITQDSSGATEEVDTSASTNEPSTSTTQENQSDNDSATDETVAPEAVEELDSSESAGDTAGSANE